MLQQLKMLGDYMEDRGGGGLEDFLGDLSDRKAVISIDLEINGSEISYKGVSVGDLGSNIFPEKKLLFKWRHSVTPDYTPTSRVTRLYNMSQYEEAQDSDEMKTNDTLSLKTLSWFEDHKEDDFGRTYETLKNNEEELRDEIKSKFEELDKDRQDKAALTVRYKDSETWKLLGDFDRFRDQALKGISKNWWDKHSGSKAENEVCSICGEDKEVFGFAFPYAFYTMDNKRYAPDFSRSNSWKNLPICEACGFKLQLGAKFIDDQQFDYYIGDNIEYYVIPEFLGENNYQFLDDVRMNTEDTEAALLDAEDFYSMEDLDTPVNLTFIFYKKENNSEKIKKKVDDVAPSHLKQLDDSLSRLYSEFYSVTSPYAENESKDIKKLNTLIYWVLPKPDRDDSQNTAFFNRAMDITSKILKGRKIDRGELVSIFSKEAISRFRNNDFYQQYAVRTFFFLEFLRENSLLDSEVKDTMKSYTQIVEDLDTEENENLKEFFEEHSEAFDTPEKKAVFLEGVLAQNLMDKQRMMRETDEPPFRKKLANLRLDNSKVKQLFPEISQTLDIYNSKAEPQYRNSYSDLRETIGHYLLLSDQNGWSISDDEISYFFTLGMSLNQVFKNNNNGEQ